MYPVNPDVTRSVQSQKGSDKPGHEGKGEDIDVGDSGTSGKGKKRKVSNHGSREGRVTACNPEFQPHIYFFIFAFL